ncbi:MAG: hypothetical protein ACFFD1_14880 [Candidatus Thorarchaeota archaeon]
MFCKDCKAIIERVRTAYGIMEFCQCPGKLKKDFMGALSTKTVNKEQKATKKRYGVSKRSRSHIYKARSTESINIPVQRTPSEYTNLPLEMRILEKQIKLPLNWNKGIIGELLKNNINDVYERFYRKFEDFFINKNTELRFLVFLRPNQQMNEFHTTIWGVGVIQVNNNKEHSLIRWYQGTNLPLDWSAKILQKEGSYLTPAIHFPVKERKKEYSEMNYLAQEAWFERLVSIWEKYKDLHKDQIFIPPSTDELYNLWKNEIS